MRGLDALWLAAKTLPLSRTARSLFCSNDRPLCRRLVAKQLGMLIRRVREREKKRVAPMNIFIFKTIKNRS
jgi:hypothetical protein